MAFQSSTFILLAIGCVAVAAFDCDVFTAGGCVDEPGFDVTLGPFNQVANSNCRRTMRLVVNVPAGDDGFTCTFTMDRPHQFRNVYSISESSTQTTGNGARAYIRGYGLDASIWTRDTANPAESNYFYNNIHTHPDDNGYSTITYTIRNDNLRVHSSQGTRATIGNEFLFNPTNFLSRYYIGINRRYADTDNQGSGVCRVRCNTF